MDDFTSRDAAASLSLLSHTAVNCNEKLNLFNNRNNFDSEEEDLESSAPFFDQYYNEWGSTAIKLQTNFEAPQFQMDWSHVKEYVQICYNVGRGNKSNTTGKDALFILLTTTKNGGQWEMLGCVFKMKGPTVLSNTLLHASVMYIDICAHLKTLWDLNG